MTQLGLLFRPASRAFERPKALVLIHTPPSEGDEPQRSVCDGSIGRAPGHGIVLLGIGETTNTALRSSQLGLFVVLRRPVGAEGPVGASRFKSPVN
jgi:hypothetical protein